MMKKNIIIAGFLSLIAIMKQKKSDYCNFHSDQAEVLRNWLRSYTKEHYNKVVTLEWLSEQTGVPVKTCSNYYYGRTGISRRFILYLIVALRIESAEEAYSLFGIFGYNRHCLKYRPFDDFSIGTYSLGEKSPKEYVDEILQSKRRYKKEIE